MDNGKTRKRPSFLAHNSWREKPQWSVLQLVVLIIGTVVLNLAPSGLSNILPPADEETTNEQVLLGSPEASEEQQIQLRNANGEAMLCPREPLELFTSFSCGDAIVSTIKLETTDPNLSMQRMIRAATRTGFPEADAVQEGKLWALKVPDDQAEKLAQIDTGDTLTAFAVPTPHTEPAENSMIITVVRGAPDVAEAVKESMEKAAS